MQHADNCRLTCVHKQVIIVHAHVFVAKHLSMRLIITSVVCSCMYVCMYVCPHVLCMYTCVMCVYLSHSNWYGQSARAHRHYIPVVVLTLANAGELTWSCLHVTVLEH